MKPKQIDELVKAYEDGIEVSTLVEQFGIHRTTVMEHLKRRNIRRRNTKLQQADVNRAVQLYESGQTLAAIGHELRVDPSTIKRALVNADIKLRNRGRQPKC